MAAPVDLYSKVPVLSEDNFSSWTTSMKMVLIERGLPKVVLEPKVTVKSDEDADLAQKLARRQ